MKRALITLVLLFAPIASAQEPRALNLRIEPHFLLLTELAVDAQFRLGDRLSLGPTVSYMLRGNGIFVGWKVGKRVFFDDTTERLGLGLRGAWYLSGVDLHSLYVAPFAKVLWNTVTSHQAAGSFFFIGGEPEREGKFTEIDAGVTVGYQWVFRVLTLNAGLGIARYWHPETVRFTDASGGARSYTLNDDKFGLQIDAGMGFRF